MLTPERDESSAPRIGRRAWICYASTFSSPLDRNREVDGDPSNRGKIGAMTPDTNEVTVNGISRENINTTIDLMRQVGWRWAPMKQVYIPKRDGKRCPLGLPSWSSKVMQKVARRLLDASLEPPFSDHSHDWRERYVGVIQP